MPAGIGCSTSCEKPNCNCRFLPCTAARYPTPEISSRSLNPSVTPRTRLLNNVRCIPHIARARSVCSRGATEMPVSSMAASTSATSLSFSSPLGPFTNTVPASTLAVTPLGRGTGFLPIRDIRISPSASGANTAGSEHPAQHLSADIFRASIRIRHDSLRCRENRDAQTAAVRFQLTHRVVYPASRRRDAGELANHGPPLVIFQLDVKLRRAAFHLHLGVVSNETFILQHVKQARP